jgi:DNA-binding transcriptional LysR family regulator
MDEIDYSQLDGRSLRLFLAVVEEGSVTGAAERLGLTQSAVSHSLERLRTIVHDPLFVKSGRGIVATSHALGLVGRARALLDDMKSFASGASFDPGQLSRPITIAANDFQCDLLLPALLQRISAQAPRAHLCVLSSLAPSADLLRENRCDLIVTPIPPSGSDIVQKRLFADRWSLFYDPDHGRAPRTLAEFSAARHVTVMFEGHERLEFDKALDARGIEREIAVSVPNFSGVAAFLRGTPMVASLPGLLHTGSMKGFGCAPLPFEFPELPMYMVWHHRNRQDPAHLWLRAALVEVVRRTLGVEPDALPDNGGAPPPQDGGTAFRPPPRTSVTPA